MKNFSVWIGIFIFLFADFILWRSLSLNYYGEYGPGAGFLPRWLGGILAVLSLLYIIQSMRGKGITFKEILPKGRVLFRLLSIVGSIILFILIAPYTGYITAGVVVLLILLLPEYKWYSAFGISIVVTLGLFFVFESVLNIPLPVNMWGW